MIRYKDKIFPDYFIDPITAVITNDKGEIQRTYILHGRPVFKKMHIHVIQVHTHIGYKQGFVIHHIDHNKMNNALSNLVYLTNSEHAKTHNETRVFSKETKRKMSKVKSGENNPCYGTKFKWINDGIQNKRCPLDEDIPEGFVRGRLKTVKLD